MLHDEMAAELRGKAISSFVYPLDFREFLLFHGVRNEPRSTADKAAVLRLFDEYLQWGSYPVMPGTPASMKEAVLRQYFDTMILRDIIQRYEVSKPRACIATIRHLTSNIAKPYTVKRVHSHVSEGGYQVGRETVSEYVRWAEDSWLLFSVPVFSASTREQERNYKKLYCVDWALARHNSTIWDGTFSRGLENAVFIHLKRRFSRVHYYLTKEMRREVDFVGIDTRGAPVVAVQVCMDISDRDTLKREIEPLVSTARYFGCKDNLILTYRQEQHFEIDGITIRALPAWRWMLE